MLSLMQDPQDRSAMNNCEVTVLCKLQEVQAVPEAEVAFAAA